MKVIVSGLSSPDVLTDDGIKKYARAIGLYVPLLFSTSLDGILRALRPLYSSTECFGIHIGNPQTANLGDGNGWVKQSVSSLFLNVTDLFT